MQALTLAISSSGLRYLTQQLIVPHIVKALSKLVTPGVRITPQNFQTAPDSMGIYDLYENIVVTLSGGSLSNFNPTFQGLIQGANGLFTLQGIASNFSVNYSWNEQYDDYKVDTDTGTRSFAGHPNNTCPYSMSVDSLALSIPITLAEQGNSYTLTVGTVTATPSGLRPNFPNWTILPLNGGCLNTTVNQTTAQALETVDFETPIQMLLQNLFGTIPASGKLTPKIVFNFNEGDSPLSFPNDQGLSLGVTGNVTWEGSSYTGPTTPPKLGVPAIDNSKHVHFYVSDYEFNELYWAFFKDGRLTTTITARAAPIPAMLNTNYYKIGPLCPLYKKYPNLQMKVDVRPLAAPTVAFQTVYQLGFGDNGVLTTQEAALPTDIYNNLATLSGSVYLTPDAYTKALQATLGPAGDQYLQQIQQASVVAGPFSQVYQVTTAGMTTLQSGKSKLPAGVYALLSGGLIVGQVFVNAAWLLAAVENALSSPQQTQQYAPQIEAAFAVAGSYPQVYWVTPGLNGGLSALVDALPPEVFNDLTGLENIVYQDLTGFLTALQNAVGPNVAKYLTQIQNAAQVSGAVASHEVEAVFSVIKDGQAIPVFTIKFEEADFQQNFRLGVAGYSQTVQFDFQLLQNETTATLVKSSIPGIDNSTFPSIWNFALQPVYALEKQKMAHTGVPLPFMAGFQFLFNQAAVVVQPGYADVLANVQYIGTPSFTESLGRAQTAADLETLTKTLPLVPERAPMHKPARYGAGAPQRLHRTRAAAAQTRLVRRGAAVESAATKPLSLQAALGAGAGETHDLHFALGHLPDSEQFHLHVGGKRIALHKHTPETLTLHASRNRALGLLDAETRSSFTHFAESVSLPSKRACLRVTYPSQSAPIPELALMAVHIPIWARRAQRERRLHRTAGGVPHALALLGVTAKLNYAQRSRRRSRPTSWSRP